VRVPVAGYLDYPTRSLTHRHNHMTTILLCFALFFIGMMAGAAVDVKEMRVGLGLGFIGLALVAIIAITRILTLAYNT